MGWKREGGTGGREGEGGEATVEDGKGGRED